MELRLYTFINFYLSSLQQGIQSLHILGELNIKYPPFQNYATEYGETVSRFTDWQRNHKTVIVLNGGTMQDIRDLSMFFATEQFNFPAPWAVFNEDDMSLGGIQTGVGVVLPETIYNTMNYRQALDNHEHGSNDFIASFPTELYRDCFFFVGKDGNVDSIIKPETAEHRLITRLKRCSLAK